MATRIAPTSAPERAVEPAWSIDSARTLYNIEGWGAGYFDVNDRGNVVVRPDPDRPDVLLDLRDLTHDLEEKGVGSPGTELEFAL